MLTTAPILRNTTTPHRRGLKLLRESTLPPTFSSLSHTMTTFSASVGAQNSRGSKAGRTATMPGERSSLRPKEPSHERRNNHLCHLSCSDDLPGCAHYQGWRVGFS